VQRLQRHRSVVGQPQPQHLDDHVTGRDLQHSAEPGACVHLVDTEYARRRDGAPLPHILGERRDRQALGDLRLGDERPRPVAALKPSLTDQLLYRTPKRHPGHTELRC
jgi:hypothetical protein